MRISNDTWLAYRIKYGDYFARRTLSSMTRSAKLDALRLANRKRDPTALIMDLVHQWPGGTPAENRLRFSGPIRMLIQRSRAHRERIFGYCSPNVSRQLLS